VRKFDENIFAKDSTVLELIALWYLFAIRWLPIRRTWIHVRVAISWCARSTNQRYT
jgi:hypothetical protein